MNYYKINYEDGRVVIDSAGSTLELVRKYDLATRENDSARITQLEDEQAAYEHQQAENEKLREVLRERGLIKL